MRATAPRIAAQQATSSPREPNAIRQRGLLAPTCGWLSKTGAIFFLAHVPASKVYAPPHAATSPSLVRLGCSTLRVQVLALVRGVLEGCHLRVVHKAN